jgi:acyl-CoA synthetase (AMP-forming)/AMP-acid ligase II
VNIALLLEMVAEGDPDRIVVGGAGGGMRATELLEGSRGLASFLLGSGAEHVAYFGLNSDVLPLALFGAAMAGLPFVPLNYRSTDEQLTQALDRISPFLAVADDEGCSRLASFGAPNLLRASELGEVTKQGTPSNALPAVSPDDVAILLFTSGTTGKPKAAILRHRHLVSYIFGSVEFLGCDPSEAQLVSVPPYHIAGMSAVLSSLYSGRRIVYLPAFDPRTWVRTAIDEGVTHAMVVPTMLGRILLELETADVDIPTLRHLSYGGGRMPTELVERALRALPQVDFVNAYGLTETSSTIAMLTPDDHREAMASSDPAVRARLASVGRPLPALEVEIRNADGAPVADGSPGEIWVRGDQVAGEYIGQDGASSDGWFRTKDAGYFDQEGYLFVEGRLDDVIVRGGENISPGEVEDVIARHPAVTEVAVVGIPDPEWGEAVAAVVVLKADATSNEADVQDWVRQHLRSNKVPAFVFFRDELPYNSTGKLLRRVLRDEIATVDRAR